MRDRPDDPGDLLAGYMPQVHDRLHELAESLLLRESVTHRLDPAALVNEVYLKFNRQLELDIKGRVRFLALAATAMRQVLVDRARYEHRQKRGGHVLRLSLDALQDTLAVGDPGRDQDVLDLHRALEKLAEAEPEQARIVEMRFFAGLTEVEIARELDVSERTVRSRWGCARDWLRKELG